MPLTAAHLAPNGFCHGGSVVAIADTAAGWGAYSTIPSLQHRTPAPVNFATIQLNANFLGSALTGVLRARASLVHGGRTTQVWDVDVFSHADASLQGGKRIAVFRATQALLTDKTTAA